MWGHPSSKVINYQINAALPKYFWLDNQNLGIYKLCKGDRQTYDFYIVEIDKHLTQMPEGEKQARFGEAIFAWSGRFNGQAYDYKPMIAATLEEAKRELEVIYDNVMQTAICALEKGLEAVLTEYAAFQTSRRRD